MKQKDIWADSVVIRMDKARKLIEAAILAEREACAKVCEEKRIQMNYSEAPYNQCAAAIRARGEK